MAVEIAQKKGPAFQEAEQLPEVEAGGGQQRVAAISGATLQPVAPKQTVVFGVADDRFDDRATFQPAFDFVGDSSSLAGDVNRSVRKSQAMSLVSLVDRDAPRGAPDDFWISSRAGFSV